MATNSCHEINSRNIRNMEYLYQAAGCLILSKDNRIILQQRDALAPTFPNFISTFGGGIESGETPIQALIRELKEELGAVVLKKEIIQLGAVAVPETNYRTLIHLYFWHDKHNAITGCYEGSMKYINDPVLLNTLPNVMDDVLWAIEKCKTHQLIK